MILGVFIDLYIVCLKTCECPRCLWSLALQVVSSFYSHLCGTRTKIVPPYPAENKACCTIPGGHQQILVQSSASYPFIPLPPPDRECVTRNILRDHAINGTKEEIHAFKT
jgi:hypothetical protein